MKETIQQELKEALREKRETEVSVLRLVNAAILQREKEKRYKLGKEEDTPLTDEEVLDVISSEAKKRKESIVEFEKGQRQDLVSKEKQELEVLQKYLPEQLPEEELKKLAKEAVEKTGAKEMKDIGKVMAELMPKVKGRADGSLVSKAVRDLLEHDSNQ